MKRNEFDHVIWAAGAILNASEVPAIGSQAIHATRAIEDVWRFEAADIFALEDPDGRQADLLAVIGELSPFHDPTATTWMASRRPWRCCRKDGARGLFPIGVRPPTASPPSAWSLMTFGSPKPSQGDRRVGHSATPWGTNGLVVHSVLASRLTETDLDGGKRQVLNALIEGAANRQRLGVELPPSAAVDPSTRRSSAARTASSAGGGSAALPKSLGQHARGSRTKAETPAAPSASAAGCPLPPTPPSAGRRACRG